MRSYHDDTYLDELAAIRKYGVKRNDRTGTGTLGMFGPQMRFDLRKGFPLLTTKKVHWKSVVHELLWMLSGSTNVKDLQKVGVSIWDEWADENGELGPVYGAQWRSWPNLDYSRDVGGLVNRPIDQIANVQESLRKNPDSRRHIVSAWNPADVDKMKLPPCHCLFQFFSAPDESGVCSAHQTPDQSCRICYPRVLHCHLYQRSADMFLGVPFNIASYALLTQMMAQTTGHTPGVFIHTLGDAHIYLNHLDQVTEQLARMPLPAPTVKLNPDVKNILDFKFEDITLEGYEHHPAIKAPVAV